MCSCHSIPECCVMFSGIKLSMGSFVLLLTKLNNHKNAVLLVPIVKIPHPPIKLPDSSTFELVDKMYNRFALCE